MSTLLFSISRGGRIYNKDHVRILDPNNVVVVESTTHLPLRRRNNNNYIPTINELEGGIPQVASNQQQEDGISRISINKKEEELLLQQQQKKKENQIQRLQAQLEIAEQQLEDQRDKIYKYDEAVEELYKSRKQFGQSEVQVQSLNVTLSDANDKIDKVKSILLRGMTTTTTTKQNEASKQH